MSNKLTVMRADPVIRQAFTPAIRTIINFGLSFGDLFPGLGSIGSWTADLAKLWADYRYWRDCKQADKEGRDRKLVKKSVLNLTPDVSWAVAIGTEVPDVMFGDWLPSHLIETLFQLHADWPVLWKAVKQISTLSKKQAP